MKNTFVLTILGVILCTLALWLGGCRWPQPGETTAEGQRRHIRNARINNEELMADIDKVLLTDKPSKLSDKRIP